MHSCDLVLDLVQAIAQQDLPEVNPLYTPNHMHLQNTNSSTRKVHLTLFIDGYQMLLEYADRLRNEV